MPGRHQANYKHTKRHSVGPTVIVSDSTQPTLLTYYVAGTMAVHRCWAGVEPTIGLLAHETALAQSL